jgi:hypothetical protein
VELPRGIGGALLWTMQQGGLSTVGVGLAVVLALAMGGCSTSAPARGPVQVVYRFDGVRSGGGGAADEWTAIRGVLAKHSKTNIVEEKRRRTSVGASDISDYRATLTLPNMAAADAIHTEIEGLREGESKMEFGLVETQIGYRGNAVAAGVTMYVSGFATQGYRVRLFPNASADPVELTAGRNGLWSAKLGALPEDGWIYGISEDPSGKVRPRCFRVNITNQKQETVSEADFWKKFPQWKPAVEAPPKKDASKEK